MKNYIIYIVAFLEGFTTLSVEIVALRKFTPIVGTNSISTSIILGVILLALSYGYYVGGKISANNKEIEKVLLRNLTLASLYYFFISFSLDTIVLEQLLSFTGSYFISILFSSIILFFIPVFLASQTIPLLSEFLKGGKSGEKMGKLLFYSTVGSFVGAVSTSIFLFSIFGVYKTGLISSIILILCAFILSRFFLIQKRKSIKYLVILIIFVLIFIIKLPPKQNIVFQSSNAYHNIDIYDLNNKRIFLLNGSYSSGINISNKTSFFKYINELVMRVEDMEPKNILVIGAAGFTFPNDIANFTYIEKIDVVDIDKGLKNIAEKYFLEKKIDPKIVFYPEPARFFLNKIQEKTYDFILVDAYVGESIPSQFLTREFFSKLKEVGDNIYLNIILDSKFESNFAKNILTTINNTFEESYYKNVNNGLGVKTNIIITNNNIEGYIKNENRQGVVYTDDKNSIEIDIFKSK